MTISGAGRGPSRRRHALPVVLAALVVVLGAAGCGGSAQVDKGGFTDKDRTNAQAALNTFKGTAIPVTVVQLTATIGLPSVCRVHYEKKDPDTLYLIMAWAPLPRTADAYTYFTARIGSKGPIPASLHLGVEQSLQQLVTHYGVAYTTPFDPCQIDSFGNLSVVPWTTVYPPSGKARKKFYK